MGASAVIPSLARIAPFVSRGSGTWLFVTIIAPGGATTWACILDPEDMEVAEAGKVSEQQIPVLSNPDSNGSVILDDAGVHSVKERGEELGDMFSVLSQF